MVGDMVPENMWDGWEASLVALAQHRDFANPKKGTGAAFAIGVTRDQALVAHAGLLQDLRNFRDLADADLAALLQGLSSADLNGRMFRDLFNPRVRHSVGVGALIIVAHERRHLWQAERVRDTRTADAVAGVRSSS